jgi:hypothetical protein
MFPSETSGGDTNRGRNNFIELYTPLADTWEVYDNSGFEPFLVAFGGHDEPTTILEMESWEHIKEGVQ